VKKCISKAKEEADSTHLAHISKAKEEAVSTVPIAIMKHMR